MVTRPEKGGPEEQVGRITTGNAPADRILGGGFPANTINIVMGQPGTGKTVLVEQLLFANAEAGRPVLYLTTLSEPLAKVVRFVQSFDFYDENKIGTSVVYQSVSRELVESGISALVPRVKEAIKSIRPAILVIDSFRALHDLTDSTVEFRHAVHDLTGLLTAYNTTAFLIGEYHQEDIRHHPEFAVADGVVELSRHLRGTRDERYFRILKLRGSRYREGAHAFRITSAGLVIHPRLVTPRVPRDYEPRLGRVSTGVPDLDTMLHGGLQAGSATLLAGPSGSGKTTLALQFALEGVRQGEASLCVNFQENPTQLGRSVRSLAGDAGTADALQIMYSSPVELQIDSIIVELFRRIEAEGLRRVVFDSVGDLGAATGEPHRLQDYLYALIQHLAVNGIASIFTLETQGTLPGGRLDAAPISYMADNLILLDMGGEETTRRTIRVLKTRGSAHDPNVREFTIGPDGIRFLPGST